MKLAKKWRPAMRILVILTILVPYFSSLAVLLPQDAEAITNEPQVIFNEENYGKVEASYVEKEATIEWTIDYQKYQDTSTNDDVQRLMKLRLEQVANGVGTVKNMNDSDLTEEDDWYVEKEFSAESKGTLIVEMPKDVLDLTIEVQMDEQRTTIQEVETAVLAAEAETAETTEAAESAVQTEEITETVETSDILSSTDAGPHTVTAEVAAEEPQPEAQPEVRPEAEATEPAKEAQEENVEAVEPSETATSDTEETEAVISDESAQGRVQTAAWNFNPLLDYTGTDATDRFGYTTNDTGTFPTNGTGFHLEGGPSNEIVNYDYSSVSKDFVPTTNILGSDSGFYGGYHDYDGAYLKKSVIPTNDPNQFTVQLDMIGDITKSETPLDVVLVLDKSSSMNDKASSIVYGEWEPISRDEYYNNQKDGYEYERRGWWLTGYTYYRRTVTGEDSTFTRWEVMKEAVEIFTTELLKNGEDGNIQMGLVGFGSTRTGSGSLSNPYVDSVWGEHSVFGPGSGFTKVSENILGNPIYNTAPTTASGTPTFLGIDAAYELLTSDSYGARDGAEKVIIFLTDGLPTFSGRTSGINTYTGLSQLTPSSLTGRRRYTTSRPVNSNSGYFQGDGIEDESANTITHMSKRRAANEDIRTYSIGYANTSISGLVLPSLGEDGAYDATNSAELLDVLNTLLAKLIATIQGAVLNDPMSAYVERISGITTEALTLDKKTSDLKVTPKGTSYPLYAQTIDDSFVESTDGSINLSNITLGGTEKELQGYRITYTVELKANYRDGKFYPTNGPTYLQNGDKKFLHFAVPSVKNNEMMDIPVQKVWVDDKNEWDTREDIVLQLQEKTGNTGTEDDWTDVDGKIIDVDENMDTFEGIFKGVPLNKEGARVDYRIVERVKVLNGYEERRVYGYTDPVYEPKTFQADIASPGDSGEEVTPEVTKPKVTNTLKYTGFSFTKVGHNGKTPLEGVKFTLTREGTVAPFIVYSNDEGEVNFSRLPVGQYTLSEEAPKGYEQVEVWTGKIKQNSDKEELIVEGLPEDEIVVNKLKPFDLSILKVNSVNENALKGAVFELYGKYENEELTDYIATATTGDDGIASFKLEAGKTYYIKETEAPDGFIMLDGIFTVKVDDYGSVTVSYDGTKIENATFELVSGTENNTIQFTAENRPKGQLPSTGGPGRKSSMIAAAVLIVFATGTTVYYVYRNRKGAK